jgi:hypothetical protein
MAYSTAIHPKIYWYLNNLHVAGPKSPLPKSCNCCLIQHLVARASKNIDRCCSSIRTNIARENASSGPMLLPCSERIFRTRRVERAVLGLSCNRIVVCVDNSIEPDNQRKHEKPLHHLTRKRTEPGGSGATWTGSPKGVFAGRKHHKPRLSLKNNTAGVGEREGANRTKEAGNRDEVEGVVVNTLDLFRGGAVGFIDWLGLSRGAI